MTKLATKAPQFIITPQIALVDEPLQIRLSGCNPKQTVKIQARSTDGNRNPFESYGFFQTDEQGVIDLSKQKPISGTYEAIDSMGLLWSMKLDDPKKHALFTKSKSTPFTVTITAELNGDIIASVDVIRAFAAPHVSKTQVDEQGMIGSLYQPTGPDSHPGVLILGGSDGGMRESAAALLASHGYAAFSLAYFGIEDVPEDLVNIPLEYFETAIHWLQQQPHVHANQIAVVGFSRGGELALQLGTMFPEIKAVVAGSPSGVRYAGLRNFMGVPDPAWTYENKPLIYLQPKNSVSSFFSYFSKLLTRKPISNLSVFHNTLKNKGQIDAARIPVERIQAPIMLISGGDDQLWPSSLFSNMIMERLTEKNHPYPNVHLHYKDAGHFLCFPFTFPSMPPEVLLSNGPFTLTFGGSANANAQAAKDSWPKILAFLDESLS
ncbi:acyl-CoA thioester hydrolase/BAAT C-terminal domain-containing protein [Oceanobacillus profundus]|uniref:acyl-CoA thioester hydrolase/BAAT C-terminal domain-containing protein n=1 Tax=Oceanobacillus TaxID=182709 RepID=UPI0026E2DD46|nr:acyl-CoA thioester hydrolase/BAAT C-terminal domain-containing protein [Oceanobacillus profundus]MDO6449859.1 acyl-CoA thioester hydrolase/BAAT C-terminal domain-containing protein [Oceanobacillus profundus]